MHGGAHGESKARAPTILFSRIPVVPGRRSQGPGLQALRAVRPAFLVSRHHVQRAYTRAWPRTMRRGGVASRVQVTGRDELGALASGVHDMADRLGAAYGELAARVKELERCERELSLLREIDEKLLAGVPLQDLLSMAIEAFGRIAEAQGCVLVTADPEGGEPKLVASWVPDPEGAKRHVAMLKPRVGKGGSLGRAIATRATVLLPDVTNGRQMERHREDLVALGMRAILAVPLLADDQVLGAVGIGYSTPRRFPEADVRAVEGFANQLAVAWEQARLREEAKGRWRLQEASRIKALFIANMSHELRTPLSSIIGFAELLRDETFGPLNDKQRRYAQHIHASGKHLLALIGDILDFSKVEAGKIELRREPLALPDALDAVVALLRSQA